MQVLKVTCSTSVNVYGKKYRNLASPSSTRTTQQYNNTSDEHQLYHWYLLTKLTTYGSTHSTTSRQTTSTSQDSTTTLQSNGLKLTLRDGTTTLQLDHVLQSTWKDDITNSTTNYTKLTQTCSSSYRNCKTYRPLTKSDSSSMPLVENARPGNSNTATLTQPLHKRRISSFIVWLICYECINYYSMIVLVKYIILIVLLKINNWFIF
jgi:hypothetical protein